MTATRREIPKPWKDLMDRRGIKSIRRLAEVAGLVTSSGRPDHIAINNVIMKGASTSTENMVKVADVLEVPVEELYRITSGVPARPLTMPVGTEKLSERQKNAIAEIIRTMVEEKEYVERFVDEKSVEPAERVQEKNEGAGDDPDRDAFKLAAREGRMPGQAKRRGKPAQNQG